MNFLYLTQQYISGHGGYQYELIPSLIDAGHNVTVLAANKDSGSVYQGINFKIIHMNMTCASHDNLIMKAIIQLLMPLLMKHIVRRRLNHCHFDAVIMATPPITLEGVFRYCKKRFRCKSILTLKDIFPQGAVDLGYIKKNSLIYNYFSHIEKKMFMTASFIGVTSKGNMNYVLEHYPYVDRKKLIIISNAMRIRELESGSYRKRFGIPDNHVVCLFGGNLGVPQHIGLILTAITKLQNDNVSFFICGNGSEYDKIDKYISDNNLHCVNLIKYLPYNEYEKLLSSIDICLITLDPRFTVPNTPDKLTAYMAYGKPIVAATDMSTDIRDILEDAKAGLWSCSDNKDAFIVNISKLINNMDKRVEFGKNARRYYEQNLTTDIVIKTIERIVRGD